MAIVDILPECYVDTNVVNTLLGLSARESTNHCHSCNKVGQDMKCGKLANQFAVGVIDNDKRQHSYVQEFDCVRAFGHIEVLKHHERPHYIIRTTPAMERFLLDVAAEEGVALADFGLPSELKALSALTKQSSVKDDANLKRLVRRLCSHPEMKALQSILQYLHRCRYSVSLDELKRLS